MRNSKIYFLYNFPSVFTYFFDYHLSIYFNYNQHNIHEENTFITIVNSFLTAQDNIYSSELIKKNYFYNLSI